MEHSIERTGSETTQRGVMDRVKERATAQLSAQKDRATDGLGSVAQAVRQSAEPLRQNQQDTIAQYVEKAADQLEQFSSRLRERNLGDLVNDAQQLARRQPALFIAGAFAVGVIGARFLKSSSQNQNRALQRYDSATENRFSSPYSGEYAGGPRGTGGF